MKYIEVDCTITHEGRSFTATGAMVTPERIVAYVGKIEGGRGFKGALGNEPQYHALTDWHGNRLGTIRLGEGWRVWSYVSDRMYQAYATVDGITYTGRTAGEGMVFNGKRVKGGR